MILALTRTNCFKMLCGNKGSFWQKHDLSQDSWIFVSPIKKINLTIFIGWQGCDNRLAYELYKNGTLDKSKMLAKLHPDIAEVVWKFNRWHHKVDYKPFKKNKLKKKKGLKIKKGINNYGMKVVKI